MSGHIIPKDAPQIPVPERLVKPSPLIGKLKEAAKPLAKNEYGWTVARRGIHPLEVSRQQLSRALRIMQALISESLARGYEVAESAQNQRDLSDVLIIIRKEAFAVRIKEKGGALTLHLPRTYNGQRNWSDGKKAPLEQKLGMVLLEMERQAAEAETRQLERERQEEERRKAQAAAVEEAKARYRQDQLAETLKRQVGAWRLARDIRGFAAAARGRGLSEDESAWIEWAERHAEGVDPLSGDLSAPETQEPSAANLRPYLGWEPWGFL